TLPPPATAVLDLAHAPSAALLGGLPRRRPHALDAVRVRRRDRGAHHQPRLVRRPRPAAVHGGAVVPHDDVALLPFVHVVDARRGGARGEVLDQCAPFGFVHAFDG